MNSPGAGHPSKLDAKAVVEHLDQLDRHWALVNEHQLERAFVFQNFADAGVFVASVAELAEEEGLYPDVRLSRDQVTVRIWTPTVDGLTENDFILGKKVDELSRTRTTGGVGRVSVVGSGSEEHAGRAEPLGAALARLGVDLITGGGGGVMAAAARGFVGVRRRRGRSIGILPAAESGDPGPPPRYPNRWVEIPIYTHLPARGEQGKDLDSRNHLVALSGDLVVALPGAAGTLSEVELALRYRRPVIAYLKASCDLPGLQEAVPWAQSMDDVLRFLRNGLGMGDP